MLNLALRALLASAGRGFDVNGIQMQVGRSVLALGTLVTFVFNADWVFAHNPNPSEADYLKCSEAARLGLICLSEPVPGLGRLIGIAVCAFVILGLVPALSSWAFAWVAGSVFWNVGPVDGGDQVTVCLGFLLAILSLTDRRLLAWRYHQKPPARIHEFMAALWLLIPVQMAFVYLNSAIAKLAAPVWIEGTALWYWIQHPGSNAQPGMRALGLDLLASPLVSALMTWGVIAFEVALALVILLGGRSRKVRWVALVLGLLFHLAIALTIGLVSFFFAMSAGLILALWRPRDAIPWAVFRTVTAVPSKVSKS